MGLSLWPDIWSNFINISCVHEKNMYSSIIGYTVLSLCFRSNMLFVLFESPMSSIASTAQAIIFDKIVLKFPITVIELLIFLFLVNKFCFTYFETMLLVAYKFRIIPPLPNSLKHMSLHSDLYLKFLKEIFARHEYVYFKFSSHLYSTGISVSICF